MQKMMTAEEVDGLSDQSVISLIQNNGVALNLARKEFANARRAIARKEENSKMRYSPITMRREELKACIAIINMFNGVQR